MGYYRSARDGSPASATLPCPHLLSQLEPLPDPWSSERVAVLRKLSAAATHAPSRFLPLDCNFEI